MDQFLRFLQNNKWTAICVSVGLLLAILFFTIGFWRTMLLFVILGLCFVIGYLLDRGGVEGVEQFFSKLFDRSKRS